MPIIELACSVAFVATAFLGTSLADRRTARRRKNRRIVSSSSPELMTASSIVALTETRPAELGAPIPFESVLAESVATHLHDQANPPAFYIPCPGAGSWRKRHPKKTISLSIDEETSITQEFSNTLPLAEVCFLLTDYHSSTSD